MIQFMGYSGEVKTIKMKNRSVEPGAGSGEKVSIKGREKDFEVMSFVYIFIVVVITQQYLFVKTHRTVH